jgi:transcriptional regulator with XRE-family HTH domain
MLAGALGRSVRDARHRARRTQRAVADAAAVAQSTVSELERGRGACVSLRVWCRVARAAGTDLRAYLEAASATDGPRDAVHLRHQELIARTAVPGGWTAVPEAPIDADRSRSRAADVLLRRGREHALIDVWDWFDDVGAAFRAWDRRIARVGAAAIGRMPVGGEGPPRVCGCWVVRATLSNRRLVADHGALFTARFPGSASAWLAALGTSRPMPDDPALLWVAVRGDRLWAARPSVRPRKPR